MKQMMKIYGGFVLIVVLSFLQSCTNNPQQNSTGENVEPMVHTHEEMTNIEKAVCVLTPTEGSNVSGIVTFTRNGSEITMVAEVEGLTPGLHGFHIHEFGDCSAPDGTSAGGHYNPGGHDHAGPTDQERHVGDLGNLEADENGFAKLELRDSLISFTGENSIIGRSMIVHENEDDLVSQPTGDAGGRVACGVIGVAN